MITRFLFFPGILHDKTGFDLKPEIRNLLNKNLGQRIIIDRVNVYNS
ncbi:MAG: hypothetical protein KDK38_00620 [Leptospiraceae bacterium]|nr:hypothetical protein [Leptospiraceae bacterium]